MRRQALAWAVRCLMVPYVLLLLGFAGVVFFGWLYVRALRKL